MILVTGGNGYIGSHTITELIRSGYTDIVSVDNRSRTHFDAMERIREMTGVEVRNNETDICDRDAFLSVVGNLGKVDAVFHFAAYKSVPESLGNPLAYYRNNIVSLLNVLEACRTFSIPRLVFSSSCAVYGDVEALPVSEDTPIGKAENPYAETKQMGETMIRSFAAANDGFSAVILRYFNPIGADDSGLNGETPDAGNKNLMSAIIDVALGNVPELRIFGTDYGTRDGSCLRDFVHVSDIARAHVNAMELPTERMNGNSVELFNLGSGNGVSVLEMKDCFERVTGIGLNARIEPRRAGDIPAIFSDNSKACSGLGWRCTHGLESMVLSAWKWACNANHITIP